MAEPQRKETNAEYRARRYRDDPEFRKRVKARAAVNHAIRDGRLFRRGCEVCGSEKVEAHHEDYNRPLDVRWLCRLHHDGATGSLGAQPLDHVVREVKPVKATSLEGEVTAPAASYRLVDGRFVRVVDGTT